MRNTTGATGECCFHKHEGFDQFGVSATDLLCKGSNLVVSELFGVILMVNKLSVRCWMHACKGTYFLDNFSSYVTCYYNIYIYIMSVTTPLRSSSKAAPAATRSARAPPSQLGSLRLRCPSLFGELYFHLTGA